MVSLAQEHFNREKVPLQVYEETTSESVKIYNFEPLNLEIR